MARTLFRAGVVAVVAALASLVVPAGGASGATLSDPLLGGLAGPLGLAVGADGTVYVTESFGGRLTAIHGDGSAQVMVDLPGQDVAGVDAAGKGTLVLTRSVYEGVGGPENPASDTFLSRVAPSGRTTDVASLHDYEVATNPDQVNQYGLIGASPACTAAAEAAGQPPTYTGILDSHPWAVAIVPGGYLVADAAANAILHVGANGRVSTVAVLPPVAQEIDQSVVDQAAEEFGVDLSACLGATWYGEPVPTDVEVGPDGDYYVSSLPGFPEAPGAGAIYRVDASTGAVSMVVGGLSGAVDLAVAADGTIYVAELFAFQITTIVDGAVTGSVFAHSPGAVEVGPDGTVYATVGVFDDVNGGSVVVVQP